MSLHTHRARRVSQLMGLHTHRARRVGHRAGRVTAHGFTHTSD